MKEGGERQESLSWLLCETSCTVVNQKVSSYVTWCKGFVGRQTAAMCGGRGLRWMWGSRYQLATQFLNAQQLGRKHFNPLNIMSVNKSSRYFVNCV